MDALLSTKMRTALNLSPRETILERGGEIYIATKGAKVVGTCGLIRLSPAMFEDAKLTVSRETQAKDWDLTSSVAFKQRVGDSYTNESIGFKRKPLPADQPYITADIYMELELDDNVAYTVGTSSGKGRCLSNSSTEA